MNWFDVSTHADGRMFAALALWSGLALFVLVAPDRAWRMERFFVGWQYKDGHRIELSTAGRLWTRIGGVMMLVVVLGLSAATINWSAGSRVQTAPWPDGGTVYYVGDPVQSPGCTVRVFVCLKSDPVFPIEVVRYDVPQSVVDGSLLSERDELPDNTDLLLYVEDRFFPTHIVIEQAEQVTVSLYGRCAPRRASDDAYGNSSSECVSDALFPERTPGVVPVGLNKPLGERLLIDGSRNLVIEKAS